MAEQRGPLQPEEFNDAAVAIVEKKISGHIYGSALIASRALAQRLGANNLLGGSGDGPLQQRGWPGDAKKAAHTAAGDLERFGFKRVSASIGRCSARVFLRRPPQAAPARAPGAEAGGSGGGGAGGTALAVLRLEDGWVMALEAPVHLQEELKQQEHWLCGIMVQALADLRGALKVLLGSFVVAMDEVMRQEAVHAILCTGWHQLDSCAERIVFGPPSPHASDMPQRLSAVEELMETLRTELEQQRAHHEDSLETLRNELKDSMATLRQELTAKDDTIQELREKSRTMEDSVTTLRTELEQQRADHEAGVVELRESMGRLDKKPAFFSLYKSTSPPSTLSELRSHVTTFVQNFADKIHATQESTRAFLERLWGQADSGSRPDTLNEVQFVAARLWSADIKLAGSRSVAFYSMLAQATREDDEHLLRKGGMAVQKGLNSLLVDRFGQEVQSRWPGAEWPRTSFRGTGIHPAQLAFWRDLQERPDRRYRAAQPLATSIDLGVAQGFLREVSPPQVRVLFELHWGGERCLHACFIQRVSTLAVEQELLLAAYSALEVMHVEEATATADMKITLRVLQDNLEHPEFLPIPAWH